MLGTVLELAIKTGYVLDLRKTCHSSSVVFGILQNSCVATAAIVLQVCVTTSGEVSVTSLALPLCCPCIEYFEFLINAVDNQLLYNFSLKNGLAPLYPHSVQSTHDEIKSE